MITVAAGILIAVLALATIRGCGLLIVAAIVLALLGAFCRWLEANGIPGWIGLIGLAALWLASRRRRRCC